MANSCYYEMVVKGKNKDALEEFVRAMQWKGEYTEGGVGRVFEAEFDSAFDVQDALEKSEDGFYRIKLFGDCAWSIISSMMGSERKNGLENISERLGLEIEAYSSEPGFEFQEHIYVNKGTVEVCDCVDYEELWTEYADDWEDITWERLAEYDITKENYKEHANENGDICIGGYPEWEFEFV